MPGYLSFFISLLHLMRLHQRTGIWLVLWPGWWSLGLAYSDESQGIFLFFIFFLGSVVVRSAGCVINDIWDRNIDCHVERTKNRPLACGAIKLWHAVVLLGLLSLCGAGISWSLNSLTWWLSCVFAFMIMLYPLMKRFIDVPQLFLGLTINAGALMGSAAMTDSFMPFSYVLYGACFFWTLGYDTIYAHQDKKDDQKIGVKSSALVFGQNTKMHVCFHYSMMIILLIVAGYMSDQTWFYYLGVMFACVHLFSQIFFVDLDVPEQCFKAFQSNRWLGWIVFLPMLIGHMMNF